MTVQPILQAVVLVPMAVGVWLVFRNRSLARCDGLAVTTWKGAVASHAQIRRARHRARVGHGIIFAGVLIEFAADHARFIVDQIHF